MKHSILLAFAAVLCSCSKSFAQDANPINATDAGSETGNGGDRLRLVFAEGRALAAAWVKATPPRLIEDFDDGLQIPENPKVEAPQTWFLKNQTELVKEINDLKIVWVQKNNNSLCAETGRDRGAVVSLSLSACAAYTDYDAARQLIVEAVHHFDKGDRFSDHIAIQVSQVFKQGSQKIPLWTRGQRFVMWHDRSQALAISTTGVVKVAAESTRFRIFLQWPILEWSNYISPKWDSESLTKVDGNTVRISGFYEIETVIDGRTRQLPTRLDLRLLDGRVDDAFFQSQAQLTFSVGVVGDFEQPQVEWSRIWSRTVIGR
jgi:hypothetical protein